VHRLVIDGVEVDPVQHRKHVSNGHHKTRKAPPGSAAARVYYPPSRLAELAAIEHAHADKVR
jgi:hypothetical protein